MRNKGGRIRRAAAAAKKKKKKKKKKKAMEAISRSFDLASLFFASKYSSPVQQGHESSSSAHRDCVRKRRRREE